MKNGVMELDASSTKEVGANDNVLRLNPEDFPQVSEWEDGETYELSELEGAKLRQISPGEFEIIPPAPGEEGEEEMEGEEMEEPKKPAKKSGYSNRAIAALDSTE